MQIGKMNTLKVLKESDVGYTLIDEEENIVLLPFSLCNKTIEKNDMLEVFILLDSKRRLLATTQIPHILIDQPNFVTVVEVVHNLGVFIDNNTSKDTLISLDDLPYDFNLWPQVGDVIFAKLKVTSKNLIAKLVLPEEAKTILKPKRKLFKYNKLEAIVLKNGDKGTNLITKEGHLIFVYYKFRRRNYRVGELVSVSIINDCLNHTYNGTLLDQKVKAITEDATIILDYLKNNNDSMEFNTSSSVLDIEKTFNMSKGAFKRALGSLYKDRLIEFIDDKTYLIKKNID